MGGFEIPNISSFLGKRQIRWRTLSAFDSFPPFGISSNQAYKHLPQPIGAQPTFHQHLLSTFHLNTSKVAKLFDLKLAHDTEALFSTGPSALSGKFGTINFLDIAYC